MDQNTLFIIVIVVMLAGMMFWQSHKAKQQQQKVKDFRESLQPGTEVITIGGVIGKVVSVDSRYEEIVIDSDGSVMRFTFRSISKEYVRPAYVDDSEVDEHGNPLPSANPTDADGADQVPVDSDPDATVPDSGDGVRVEPIQEPEASDASTIQKDAPGAGNVAAPREL
ncbi:preprotein translocase subunit YajC [uncultured Bifidobacterium sp.]|uniref:preprotein translocase subunit YajC n=1 Tax=uncultured Bifidobacterium sp. TaxID=165187 RepID=UPI0028DC7290|nr:preprotein translocase subunit YajC [uncultured Bifidobacterium sp.]